MCALVKIFSDIFYDVIYTSYKYNVLNTYAFFLLFSYQYFIWRSGVRQLFTDETNLCSLFPCSGSFICCWKPPAFPSPPDISVHRWKNSGFIKCFLFKDILSSATVPRTWVAIRQLSIWWLTQSCLSKSEFSTDTGNNLSIGCCGFCTTPLRPDCKYLTFLWVNTLSSHCRFLQILKKVRSPCASNKFILGI